MQVVTADAAELRRVGFRPEFVSRVIDAVDSWQQGLVGGMQLAIAKNGRIVLSLWDGFDVFTSRPICERTLFPILSATKGLASMVLLHLNHLGYFEWGDRISDHWTRFGQNGKENATIEHLLSHRLGIPMLTADWTYWTDRRYMTELVEDAKPEWEPGTRYGYHGGSWGIVVDELVRRWTKGETGEVLHHVLKLGVGATDCYLGLPRDRYEDVARLAYLEPAQRASSAPLGPIGASSDYNSLDILASCQSSGGAVSSAASLVKLYALAADEGKAGNRRVWSAGAQAVATRPRNDPNHEVPSARPELRFAWGLGFMVSPSRNVYGTVPPSARVVGHPGASGAVGYADPDHRLSVALTINGVGGRRMFARYRLLGDLVQAGLRITV